MKKLTIIFAVLLSLFSFSQDMTNEKLSEIYESVSDSIQGRSGAWQFYIKDIQMISITDSTHNRMRIISPIADSNTLTDDLIKAAMIANFHTALDVRYAVTDGILWSIFIHPLKELSEHQVIDAVSQVYNANVNFGTTFASTGLTFPVASQTTKKKIKKETKSSLKKKKI
ncbi:hypothetical protein [uncultured Winogradskyella sp.]|uniref:hypothetical protein n=1 Tax=uncultured Winogradskyella sp. TaxID=395353 RepID=UPI00261FF17A|nr:hypothetical protein [uncultured Winogradskyella sp.]